MDGGNSVLATTKLAVTVTIRCGAGIESAVLCQPQLIWECILLITIVWPLPRPWVPG